MNFAEFHFLRPWWLLALPVAALLLALWLKRKQRHGNWLEVCDPELLPFLLQDKPPARRRGGLLAGGLACLLVITALAGPTWQRLPSPAFRNDAALVIALDLSASMDAADIKPSRVAKARFKIADLLKQRQDGQTALLVYGGDAFTVTPLTSDTATIASQLEALTTDIMPSPGADAGAAIRKAADLLRQAGVAQGHILLVTDGVDTDSAALVKEWLDDYRLSILAVGTDEGAPIKQPGGFLKDGKGNIVVSRLDTSALTDLARNGNGLYRQVTPGDEDIDALSRFFNTVNGEAKTESGNILLQQWDEKGPWLVLLLLPWAALRFRKGLLFWLACCLLPLPRNSQALDWQSLWQNPNQRAAQAFQRQQYHQAAEQFDTPDWRAAAQYKAGEYQKAAETLKNPRSADEFYNRGNALAQGGQLQQALEAYNQALKLDPSNADAKYNKDLVERKQREQQNQQNQQQQNQQDKDKQQSEQQQQDREKSDQQQQSQQNPAEQKDRQSSQDKQQQDQNQNQPKPSDEKNPQNDAKQEQQQKPEPADEGKKDDKQSARDVEKNETERANQQLLKRIPDEPTNLLKRKFKYQYSRRGEQAPVTPKW